MAAPTNPHNAAKHAERQEHIERALELRKMGLSLRQIGEQMGVSKVTAHRWVMSGLRELAKRVDGKAMELRQLQSERLDRMLTVAWPRAVSGDLAALDKVLDIVAAQRRLYGLDAPAKVAPTTPDGETPFRPTEEPVRWVYVVPQQASSEEEWLRQQQQASNSADGSS